MAEIKTSSRQVKDAAIVENAASKQPDWQPKADHKVKPEPAGFFRGARIRPRG